MNRIAKITGIISVILIFVSSCNDKSADSPFGEMLNQPPYSGLTDSIKNQPKNDELYFRRAVLLNTYNQPEPALIDFKKAWSFQKDERYALAISTILMDKNPDSALVFLNQAIKFLPKSLILQLSLARAYDVKGDIVPALLACDLILQSFPEQVDVLKLKADLLTRKGENNEAILLLEKAYSLTPFDVELNYFLALKYAETKNEKLLPLTDSLIRADSLETHAEPYYYKGIYYNNIKDNVKALYYFDLAIKHDYNFLDGYIEKGAVLYEMKKIKEAIAVFNLALTISPKFADAWYWMAKCQLAMGQKEDAKLNYQRAYALDTSIKEAKEALDKLK